MNPSAESVGRFKAKSAERGSTRTWTAGRVRHAEAQKISEFLLEPSDQSSLHPIDTRK